MSHTKLHSEVDLMKSYFLYAAILALKLLALAPLASIMCNPEKVQRANLSDLKNLTPFWLVAALYMTTSPDEVTAIVLLRTFVLARFVAAFGYVRRLPKMVVELAFFVSFSITCYMGGYVVYTYSLILSRVIKNVVTTFTKLRMVLTISLDNPLSQTYMVHSALLAVKLLALSPLAAMTWVNKGVFENPDIVRRAYLSELKNLAPFWIVGALYVTTHPPLTIGVTLFRIFSISRMAVILGYATKPLPVFLTDLGLVVSYFITCYMSIYVAYYYRKAL